MGMTERAHLAAALRQTLEQLSAHAIITRDRMQFLRDPRHYREGFAELEELYSRLAALYARYEQLAPP